MKVYISDAKRRFKVLKEIKKVLKGYPKILYKSIEIIVDVAKIEGVAAKGQHGGAESKSLTYDDSDLYNSIEEALKDEFYGFSPEESNLIWILNNPIFEFINWSFVIFLQK